MTGPTEAQPAEAHLRALGQPPANPMDVALFTGLPPDAMPEPQAPIAHETHTVDLGPQPVAVPTPEPATPQPQHAVDLHQGVRWNPVTPEQLEQELAATWMRHVGLG